MRSRWRRRLVWCAALTVIAAALGAWVRARSADAAPDIRYETAMVGRGDVTAKVTASGTLSALVNVQVGSQVSGRVQEILVDYNSSVKAGQVIAKLDPLLFQAAVDQSRAMYATAQSNLETAVTQEANAERQYARAKSLLDRGLVTQADFEATHATYEVARAQARAARSGVDVARAALHQAEVNLGYATIVSPIAGTVISRNIDVGQTVASAFQAPILFLIAKDLRKMQVDTSVSEADVGRLERGTPASFTVDAYPGETFAGAIRQIRSSPTTVQNVVTYDAVLDVDNTALRLKPGMTANVTFIVSRKRHVLCVPNAALRFEADPSILQQLHVAPMASASASATESARGSVLASASLGASVPASVGVSQSTRKTLWILRGGRPSSVSILTGVTDGSMTEVVEGDVREGDASITDMFAAPPKRFWLF